MKKLLNLTTLCLLLFCAEVRAQLYKISLDEKVKASAMIAEGKVIAQKCFWNPAHTMIFTASTIQLYKTFKGTVEENTVEVLTQGGSVGDRSVQVSDLLALDKNQVGMFFCFKNALNLKSPTTGKVLYDVYSSGQGFLRYDFATNKAFAPFAQYNGIETGLYGQLRQLTGERENILDPSFSVAGMVQRAAQKAQPTHTTNGTQASFGSFSPAVVHGGTLNDPANNTLTISGSGFGSSPSGDCAVNFKDGNDDNSTPDYAVPYNSAYIVSWSDDQIVVNVPARAATGLVSVVLSDGTTLTSSQTLTVDFAVLNLPFDFSVIGIDTVAESEPRLMNANNLGGYSYQFGSSTAGSGISFATDPAAVTFNRAVATWQQLVGASLVQGTSTTTQAVNDDNINVIEYDNTNTGVPVMAAGVLEATYSWGRTCYNKTPFFVAVAQKTGFDILVRNPNVSAGSVISFEDGPCFPDINSYDLEQIILHELGHVLNLMHINDTYQQSPLNTTHINPGKLMHYAIVNYASRRSPDNSAYAGALYTVTPQNDEFGSCLYTSQMTQNSYTVISNDECPSSFPTTPTPPGTLVNFDLVHATSNKYKDPAFTQVDCQGEGEYVTNNAYYALKTTALNNGTLSLSISNYATTPIDQENCAGQGVRMAVYEVSSCPGGQSFPNPVACTTFGGNGALPNITNLLPNQTYLLYFDGLRNTKANFNVTLGGSALPITLAQFSGEYIKGTDELFIQIVQAVNVQSVVVEKSADGASFADLGALQVAPANLVGMHTYIDAQPFAGVNYYRLRIVDNNGNTQYSSVIKLTNPSSRSVYLYPNPVTDNLTISLSGMQPGRYTFTVYDISGKALQTSIYPVAQAAQSISIPLLRVAKGVYLVKITDGTGAVVTQQKIIKG